MNTLAKRLERLEGHVTGNGRIFALRTGPDHSESDGAEFLERRGYKLTRSDLVVCLKTFYLDERGGVQRTDAPIELLSVNAMR
jgi:hypothetical protein